ncbi:MAG: pyridoxamine 5'-phosphate oxidase [Alphaproteobacteria bacterium]|nr:pyridoxamine 5'-phosphate oxidase [Alphaproteobacteria bacterium]
MAIIHDNPLDTFQDWYAQALKLDRKDNNAVTLATANKEGRPSARIVLLKHADENGYCFFTNFTSRKGHELIENPYAALCFYWEELGKQIRIEGHIEAASDKESDDYFSSRPRGSQLGAWASHQSAPLGTPDDLVKRLEIFKTQFGEGPIPRPPFWGGFRLIPNHIEFWKEGEFRLHTRILYQLREGNWSVSRLYP